MWASELTPFDDSNEPRGWHSMNNIVAGVIFSAGLFIGILVLIGIGRRVGTRSLSREGESASKGFVAVEGALFGLLGLVLAFLFSGALSRFDWRRSLVVEEANNIGTAWLRVDLLPEDAQGVENRLEGAAQFMGKQGHEFFLVPISFGQPVRARALSQHRLAFSKVVHHSDE